MRGKYSFIKPHFSFMLDLSATKERISKADNWLRQQIISDTDQYVPKQQGIMAGGVHVEGDEIVYPGPYARFLYMGKVMVGTESRSAWAKKGEAKEVIDKDLTFQSPTAQARWFEVSKAQNEKAWRRGYEKELRKK